MMPPNSVPDCPDDVPGLDRTNPNRPRLFRRSAAETRPHQVPVFFWTPDISLCYLVLDTAHKRHDLQHANFVVAEPIQKETTR